MNASSRPLQSGILLLTCLAPMGSLAAQQPAVPPAVGPAAPDDAAQTASGADVAVYDVLQFTPDEGFIDLRASLADAWSAVLRVLADLNYGVSTDLAYVDVGGRIVVDDLWMAVEPHVTRVESFTRVRIGLAGPDAASLRSRAEIILDAVADRLQPAGPAVVRTADAPPQEPKVSYPYAPATTTVYEYVPYYVSYPSAVWAPYWWNDFGPYGCWPSSWSWHHNWWPRPWGWSPCGSGFSLAFGDWGWNWGWQWGWSGGWGNFCGAFGSPWGPSVCSSWGWHGSPWWNGPACTAGLSPWGWNWAGNGAGPGPFLATNDGELASGFDFDLVPLDGAILHAPRDPDFAMPGEGTGASAPAPRERRDVTPGSSRPRVVVTETRPRHGHADSLPRGISVVSSSSGGSSGAGTGSSPVGTSRNSGGSSGGSIVVRSGSSTPSSGIVVRLPSATYSARTSHLPTGRVSTPTSVGGSTASSGGAASVADSTGSWSGGSTSWPSGGSRSSQAPPTSSASTSFPSVATSSSGSPSYGSLPSTPSSSSSSSRSSGHSSGSSGSSGHSSGSAGAMASSASTGSARGSSSASPARAASSPGRSTGSTASAGSAASSPSSSAASSGGRSHAKGKGRP